MKTLDTVIFFRTCQYFHLLRLDLGVHINTLTFVKVAYLGMILGHLALQAIFTTLTWIWQLALGLRLWTP